MTQLDVPHDGDINLSLLSEQLGALLRETFQGFNAYENGVIVYTADELDAELAAQVTALIAAHDPTEKTAAQLEEEAREAAREAARTTISGADFDALRADVAESELDAGTKAALTSLVDIVQALTIIGGHIGAV
jgi:hypothetical protein